jgi:hypothetical protein
MLRAAVDGERLEAEVRYGVDRLTWRQAFGAWLLDEPALRSLLDAAGLAFVLWLERPGWFLAQRRR